MVSYEVRDLSSCDEEQMEEQKLRNGTVLGREDRVKGCFPYNGVKIIKNNQNFSRMDSATNKEAGNEC